MIPSLGEGWYCIKDAAVKKVQGYRRSKLPIYPVSHLSALIGTYRCYTHISLSRAHEGRGGDDVDLFPGTVSLLYSYVFLRWVRQSWFGICARLVVLFLCDNELSYAEDAIDVFSRATGVYTESRLSSLGNFMEGDCMAEYSMYNTRTGGTRNEFAATSCHSR
jgi:hypothetical protein